MVCDPKWEPLWPDIRREHVWSMTMQTWDHWGAPWCANSRLGQHREHGLQPGCDLPLLAGSGQRRRLMHAMHCAFLCFGVLWLPAAPFQALISYWSWQNGFGKCEFPIGCMGCCGKLLAKTWMMRSGLLSWGRGKDRTLSKGGNASSGWEGLSQQVLKGH